MLDGSNDTGVLKMIPVTVRIFDTNQHQQRTLTKFFDMNLMEGRDISAVAEMVSSIDKRFIKHAIS